MSSYSKILKGRKVFNIQKLQTRTPLLNPIRISDATLRSLSSQDTSTPSKKRRIDPLDTSFNDPVASFKSKTTWELVRALIVYTICSFESIVDNNIKLMKLGKSVCGEKLFGLLMKLTFYGHFVAGEDQERIQPVIHRLYSFGVKSILDYSAEEDLSEEEAKTRGLSGTVPEGGDKLEEGSIKQYHMLDKRFADRRSAAAVRTYFYKDEANCEKNMKIFLDCVQAVAHTTKGTGIAAVKLTALVKPQLLLQVSEVIMRARGYMADIVGSKSKEGHVLKYKIKPEELEKKLVAAKVKSDDIKSFMKHLVADNEGIIHLFPWSGIIDEKNELSSTFRIPDLKTGRMVGWITKLTKKDETMFRNFITRLDTLSQAAESLNVRLMIDAEQTYFQPAIARVAQEFMRKYNKNTARILNTYQCYLRAAFDEVSTDMEQAKRQKFCFGAKLVRGAYLHQERARAASMGYPDPTNPDFDATSAMYHKVLTECLRRIKEFKDKGNQLGRATVMVASHNEDTCRFAIQKMKEIGIKPADRVVCFGQLLGMCDYITFPLGQSGYSVYKYVPYGPVNEVLPYLSRRATENKGVLKKIKKEKQLLRKEVFRRIATGKMFYTPKGDYVPA